MPNVSQYEFKLVEVGEALLRSAGITEGYWSIGVNCGINVGNMGPSPKEAKPSILTVIDGVNLSRVTESEKENGLVIDASRIATR